jgi:hypothetical protein
VTVWLLDTHGQGFYSGFGEKSNSLGAENLSAILESSDDPFIEEAGDHDYADYLG